MSVDADRLDSTTPLTAAERVELGLALRETMATQGWALIDRLLTRLVNDTALAALDEEDVSKRPAVYYKGRVDALREIRATLDAAVAVAMEQAAASRRDRSRDLIATIMKPGGGPL